MLTVAAILFVVPSFFEELLFRGILHPATHSRYRTARMALAALLFVLWHPLQFWTGFGPEWSSMFVTWPFLLTVSVLSVSLVILREVSQSLWPSILFHWAVVCAWKLLFNGPF
jgi:predicted Abi (CAAX) family protease